MKKRSNSIQILLVIAISLFILALPAYLRCTNLSEANFVSSDLSFENPDQENGLPDNENKLQIKGIWANYVFHSIPSGYQPFRAVFPFVFPGTFSPSKNLRFSLLKRHGCFISSLTFISDDSPHAVSGVMHNASFDSRRGG